MQVLVDLEKKDEEFWMNNIITRREVYIIQGIYRNIMFETCGACGLLKNNLT